MIETARRLAFLTTLTLAAAVVPVGAAGAATGAASGARAAAAAPTAVAPTATHQAASPRDPDFFGMFLQDPADDALSLLADDLFRAAEANARAGAGAVEDEAARFAIDKIDQSIQRYQSVLAGGR